MIPTRRLLRTFISRTGKGEYVDKHLSLGKKLGTTKLPLTDNLPLSGEDVEDMGYITKRLKIPKKPEGKRELKPRKDWGMKFEPTATEEQWQNYWTSRGHFEPRPANPEKPTIRMLLPPPNVTGELHIGHALMISIEDALARYYRMQQHSVHWAPGTDHAGIATQSVVEKVLLKEHGMKRQQLGREMFLVNVEAWRRVYGSRILEQMSRMGASTAPSKEYYTKDPGLSEAVGAAFVELWEQGLIYRDTRMVNWSVKLQTAVSDIEVVGKEIMAANKGEKVYATKIDGAEFGFMHKFAFPLVDTEEEIVVSTTRPETIPGDRAIAVHPDDERYRHLHYKYAWHPLIPNTQIPIIPDAELVDPTFGSGAVKITPAHDVNDYAFWKRHSSYSPTCTSPNPLPIPLVQVFDTNGKMMRSCQVPEWVSHDRLHIRKRVVQALMEIGVHRGKVAHTVRVPICERSDSVIEPMLQPQWYLKMKPLAQKVKEVAERDGLTFTPEVPSQLLWDQWLDGIQDWCLSRQIWWGHRIPAYEIVSPNGTTRRWVATSTRAAAEEKLSTEERLEGCVLRQDEDVLDTWFSSGLLPLTTAGWRGGKEKDLAGWKDRYPLTFIESGGDILFFWLARMAMLCTHFSDKLPFPEIILHPLVCDAQGKKMSKSVGNVLDPLLVVNGRTLPELEAAIVASFEGQIARGGTEGIEAQKLCNKRTLEARKTYPRGITKSGADSLRMALLDYTRQSRQINMELRHVDVFRKFIIKLENAFKLFHDRKVARKFTDLSAKGKLDLQPHDRYILSHLKELVGTVTEAMEDRKLYEATEAIRMFTYDIYCAVYLEFVKEEISDEAEEGRRDVAMTVLQETLDTLLRLMHPFMPFHSEELWQELHPTKRAEVDEVTIMNAQWPKEEMILGDAQGREGWTELEKALELVQALRGMKEEEKGVVKGVVPPKGAEEFVRRSWSAVQRLGKVGALGLKVAEDGQEVGGEWFGMKE